MLIRGRNASATYKVRQSSQKKEGTARNQKTSISHTPIVLSRIIILLGLLTIFSMCNSSPVRAHTSLNDSSPVHDSKLSELPIVVELKFTDKLINLSSENPNKISIRGPKKNLLPLGRVLINDNLLTVPIADGIYASGLYKVYYRVISADGHPVSGFISFQTTKNTELKQGVVAVEQPEVESQSSIGNAIEQFRHHFMHILYGAMALLLIAGWALFRKRN